MALNLATAKYDPSLAEEGRVFDLSEGGWVRVRRWDCRQARVAGAAYDLKTRKDLQKIQRSQNAEAMQKWSEGRDLHIIVEAVLLEWGDFLDGETPFLYSKANAKALLSQEEFQWIVREIRANAIDDQEFRKQEEEEDSKNSEISSSGSSNGESEKNG